MPCLSILVMSKITSIIISVDEQSLCAYDASGIEQYKYSIATATRGIGQQFGSECTPLGKHIIRAKIGTDQPLNTIFVARRPTGEIYSEELAELTPERDWILTRILWLSGCQVGHNRLHSVDTMRRYIYIHGAPDSHKMGVPSSHGCIKMRNKDIMALYNLVSVGTEVIINN
jgi:lipoprotein-anchoring transpeptidase ErfK/SrfK